MADNHIPFDEVAVQQALVGIIVDMVGDKLGFLVAPDGTVTDQPACYISQQDVPEATLPFISIDFLSDNNNEGFLLGSGWVEMEDPLDPPNVADYPFYDTYLHYLINARCEGDGSGKILREVRQKLLWPSFRQRINAEMFSSTQLISPLTKQSDVLETEYREIYSTMLKFDTVDRIVDYSSGVFSTINYEGDLFRDDEGEDPTPLQFDGTVTSDTPP